MIVSLPGDDPLDRFLAEAIEKLPDDQREAVVRHHLEGASLRETAEAMGRRPEAVAALLHRALIVLKKRLQQ